MLNDRVCVEREGARREREVGELSTWCLTVCVLPRFEQTQLESAHPVGYR